MQDRILLAHGGGGLLTSEWIDSAIRSRFTNPESDTANDSAVLTLRSSRLAFTTDSYTVTPVFFPGGNIGDLAICGTVNDLAMSGATPKYLSLGLIIEEGLPFSELDSILDSIRDRAQEAGVAIVTGDTKVVPRGQADKIYINTAGIGELPEDVNISASSAQPGDVLIVSGPIGMHGVAVMLQRGDLHISGGVRSDVAVLYPPVAGLLERNIRPHVLRDLTRGGLAMAVHDIAEQSGVTMEIRESDIPSNDTLDAACDLLGLDRLHIACEGCFMAIVPEEDANATLEVLHAFEPTRSAAVVGSVLQRDRYPVELITPIGSRRVLAPPRGELLPRIC